jgi:hypothetical protein
MDNKGFQSLKYLDFSCGYVTFRAGSVPRLQKLDLSITSIDIEYLDSLTTHNNSTVPGGHVLVGIEYPDSLTTVSVVIYKALAREAAITAKNAITNAVNRHPNKPTLTIRLV